MHVQINLCRRTCAHTCAWKHKRWGMWKFFSFSFFWDTTCIFCDVYFFGAICSVFIIIIIFFLGQIFWKLRAKFGIYTNLGSIYFFSFFFFVDLQFFQISNWVVQRFGIWIQTCWGVIWLGDYPSCKSSGPTAWHSNPNTLRGDLTWGLPKSQIEWTNGLEPLIQTRWGVIWLGDYPSLKSSEPTVWNP